MPKQLSVKISVTDVEPMKSLVAACFEFANSDVDTYIYKLRVKEILAKMGITEEAYASGDTYEQ